MKKSNSIAYITEKQAAKLLKRPKRWFQNDRYVSRKIGISPVIPFIKDKDKRIFYTKADILKFKQELEVKKIKVTNMHIVAPKYKSAPVFNTETLYPSLKSFIEFQGLVEHQLSSFRERLYNLESQCIKYEFEFKEQILKKQGKSWLDRLFN